jgi:DNA-binding NarL/FixJ family response regulator
LALDSKILFFTSNDYPQIVLYAFNIGADGYVVKLDATDQCYWRLVDAVLLGKRYLGRLAGGIEEMDGSD